MEYDIKRAFDEIEQVLIASMMRNFRRHTAEETEKGYEWDMWQVKQLEALEEYKKRNKQRFASKFSFIHKKIEEAIREANTNGQLIEEKRILEAIKNGVSCKRASDTMIGEFFRLNDRKLESLIQATTNDIKKAETALLRLANDQYRKIIFTAQAYVNTGTGTYKQAIDMATKDFLAAGLNCVQYANGSRHTLKDYADMALRTANKRAYLQGEGTIRKKWNVTTVIMAKRGNPCPKCLPFVGKVLIDDVWSGGTKEDGPYPLMSQAIAAGLYHPRCKDSHTTYFKGISTADDTWTKEELERVERNSKQEAKEQYAKRQEEKYERLAKHSLDKENKRYYEEKVKQWSPKLSEKEEGAIIRYISPDALILNAKLRDGTALTKYEKDWIIKLDEALEKLPFYTGNLNRSVHISDDSMVEEYVEQFVIGDEYIPTQYLSTTKQGVHNREAQIQIYIENSRKGRDLGELNRMESEVLYPRHSKFRVIDKCKMGNVYYILLEEI